MKHTTWKSYAFWILLSEGVGALSGWLTREAQMLFNQTAIQPPLSPPPILFPIVWTILYALMGISAARIAGTPGSFYRSVGLNLFFTQLVMNFFWSLFFFNAAAYGFSLVWLIILWLIILLMIQSFRKIDPVAARLQIPYLVWVAFAAYLNYCIWKLN